jgi:hypothetical protein
MNNVVQFKLKEGVIVLSFKCPEVFRMNKTGDEGIVLEAHDGRGTAWIPAMDTLSARQKLNKMIPNITEWID